MALITIERSSEFINRARAYGIYIDNEKVGTIANGETMKFEVTSGTHSVYAKIDWCYSPERTITVSDEETRYCKLGAFKGGATIMIAFAVIVLVNLLLKNTIHFTYTIFLAIPLFLIMLYYFTLGRRKYLSLVEDNL